MALSRAVKRRRTNPPEPQDSPNSATQVDESTSVADNDTLRVPVESGTERKVLDLIKVVMTFEARGKAVKASLVRQKLSIDHISSLKTLVQRANEFLANNLALHIEELPAVRGKDKYELEYTIKSTLRSRYRKLISKTASSSQRRYMGLVLLVCQLLIGNGKPMGHNQLFTILEELGLFGESSKLSNLKVKLMIDRMVAEKFLVSIKARSTGNTLPEVAYQVGPKMSAGFTRDRIKIEFERVMWPHFRGTREELVSANNHVLTEFGDFLHESGFERPS